MLNKHIRTPRMHWNAWIPRKRQKRTMSKMFSISTGSVPKENGRNSMEPVWKKTLESKFTYHHCDVPCICIWWPITIAIHMKSACSRRSSRSQTMEELLSASGKQYFFKPPTKRKTDWLQNGSSSFDSRWIGNSNLGTHHLMSSPANLNTIRSRCTNTERGAGMDLNAMSW